MKNTLIKWLYRNRIYSEAKTHNSEAGFTMLEVVTVAIIIGILSAIAAPAWDAFINRQRIRAVNNQILSTLQSAQTQARGNKESITVLFNVDDNADYFEADDGLLSYKVFPSEQYDLGAPDDIKDIPPETLNIDGNINQDKIELFVFTPRNDPTPTVINFNEQGAIPEDKNTPVYITIRNTDKEDGQKCTVIQTLLGSTRTDEGKYDAGEDKGCQTE